LARSDFVRRATDTLSSAVVRAPTLTLALWTVALLIAGSGLLFIEVDASGNSALDRRSPEWEVYQRSLDDFGGDEVLVVALRSETPFDRTMLDRVERLTRRLESLPAVRRVDSLSSVPAIRVDAEEALLLDAPLEALEGELRTPGAVADLLRGDRIAPRSLISDDGRMAAINVILERDFDEDYGRWLAAARTIVSEEVGLEDFTDIALLAGVPTFRVAISTYTQREVLLFSPLTAALLLGLLSSVLRSLRAALLCVLPGIAGSIAALGAMGHVGVPLGVTTLVLPAVLIGLGCAYSMHLVLAAMAPDAAMALERVREVAAPVALSVGTTVLGFGSLMLAQIRIIQDIGLFGALGVAVVGCFALTALPALIHTKVSLVGTEPHIREQLQKRVAQRLTGFVLAHRPWVASAWVVVVAVAALGIPRLVSETDLAQWLAPDDPVRLEFDAIREGLAGISPVNVVVEPRDGGSVLEPRTLQAIDALASRLEASDGVGRAISIGDLLRQIHGAFLGDSTQPLPGSSALAEQYLLLLESVDSIGDVITPDRRRASISLRIDDNRSWLITSLRDRAETEWAALGAPPAHLDTTGLMYEYARSEDAITEGQIHALAGAIAAMCVVLFVALGSVRAGVIALLPNVVPLFVLFGGMGWLGLPIDVGTAIVASLAIGVGVDDTVHLLSHWTHGRRRGRSAPAALEEALRVSLAPLVLSTTVVSLSFAVFAGSSFTLTRNLGVLVAAIMIVYLLSDLTLLSSLLCGRARQPPPEGRGLSAPARAA